MHKKILLTLLFSTVSLSNCVFWALPAAAEMIVDTSWVKWYDGPGSDDDCALAIAVDGSGNVFVTGYSWSSETGYDYATIKYYANGDTAWLRRYNGPGTEDLAFAIAVDDSGNVYVTGSSGGLGTGSDYATIKYRANGDTAWVRRYDGPASQRDAACAIGVDDSGNVYVTGSSDGNGTGRDYATIKYDPNGAEVWVRRYNGPGNAIDEPWAMAVDGSGNVYVTGTHADVGSYPDYFDYATIKYYSNGNTAWVRTYNGPVSERDQACAIAIDNSGNVFVTGWSNGSGTGNDYATIKYDASGIWLWVRRYDGTASAHDWPAAIASDDSGNVYVTGTSYGVDTDGDVATMKYDSDGNELWVRRYNGPANDADWARAIAIDGTNNVYVTGASLDVWETYEVSVWVTIKYAPSGDELWVRRYNGPGHYYDQAEDVGVDGSGHVYVTGSIWAGAYDYATIKYFQILRGDVNGDGVINSADVAYLINYLFKGGPAPEPLEIGNTNCDEVVNSTDVVYLINYLFKGGPPPEC